MKKNSKPWNKKERRGVYDIDYIFDNIINFEDTRKDKVILDGIQVKSYCIKYEVFRKSTKCMMCGLPATFFAVERDITKNKKDIYNLNLYGVNRKSKEELFTIDHIKPKFKGGLNKLDNYQTSCYNCNQKKGSKYEQ